MNIAQFNENLATAFAVANKKIIKRLAVNAFGDTLHLTVRRKKEEKKSMSVPHVIQWNSTEIQEFKFVRDIKVEI